MCCCEYQIGHIIRPDLQELLILGKKKRSKKGRSIHRKFVTIFPNSIMDDASRFEIEMKKAREKAIYKKYIIKILQKI